MYIHDGMDRNRIQERTNLLTSRGGHVHNVWEWADIRKGLSGIALFCAVDAVYSEAQK